MKGYIGVVSLGCDKNRVDSEIMLGYLAEGGYEITNDCAIADVIIVNTCAFLESARAESIDTIIEMAGFKNEKCKLLVVTGCLGQHFGGELLEGLGEADLIVGINQYPEIVSLIDNALIKKNRKLVTTVCHDVVSSGKRILTTSSHTAYLKIADGCNHYCSYCLIPYIRGHYRSRTLESVLTEAKQLVENGVREIILVAQDVTRYGYDLHGKSIICDLIKELNAIENLQWVRLLYCYPEQVTDELIETINKCEKVVKYLDIPLQHVDDRMLKLMNRRVGQQQTYDLFDKLAKNNILVRSTFICGFPSETPETHQTVADFLQKYKLCNVGFFAFSREEGTRAYTMENQIDERDKQDMVANLYDIQSEISHENMAKFVGENLDCLIDNSFVENGITTYIGRSYFMTPDVDGVVYITSAEPLTVGKMYNVKITGSEDFDLIGEIN